MPQNQNMLKALDYMENNLTKNISLYDISKEAGFSVPHFYRLFKRLTGDTVGAYLLRRRLSLAAGDLTGSRKTVAEISYEYGFESHDVFTRAFSRTYGMSPVKYRNSRRPPPMKRTRVMEGGSGAGPDRDRRQMRFAVLQLPGFHVTGMECAARQWDSDFSIGRLWSTFLTRSGEIRGAAAPLTMYGICEFDTCRNGQFTYMAAIGADPSHGFPSGMTGRHIRPQRFFQATVPETVSVPDAYAATAGYAKSLGYEPDEYDQIEVYEEIFRDPSDHVFKLLLPIK